MFTAFRVYAAMIAVLGFSTAFGSEDLPATSIENLLTTPVIEQATEAVAQASWLNPDTRIGCFFNIPAIVAGFGAGTLAIFANWATMHGSNLYMMRRDVRAILAIKPDFDVTSISAATPEVQKSMLSYIEAQEKATARLARHANMSILRRTMPFRAVVFALPAYVTYHHVAQNDELRAQVCESLVQTQRACVDLMKPQDTLR